MTPSEYNNWFVERIADLYLMALNNPSAIVGECKRLEAIAARKKDRKTFRTIRNSDNPAEYLLSMGGKILPILEEATSENTEIPRLQTFGGTPLAPPFAKKKGVGGDILRECGVIVSPMGRF